MIDDLRYLHRKPLMPTDNILSNYSYKSLMSQVLDYGHKTSANSGGGSFSSKVEKLDSACIAIEFHIVLFLAAHAVCPSCDKAFMTPSFAHQTPS